MAFFFSKILAQWAGLVGGLSWVFTAGVFQSPKVNSQRLSRLKRTKSS